jgi:hypothetical protein
MEGGAGVNDTVVVAIISALGLVLASALPAVLVQAFRRENAQDHATVRDRLDGIDAHIGVVEAKIEHVQYGLGTHLLEHKRKEELNDGNTRPT